MSKKADEYNQRELVAGRLTIAHITKLVEHWQESSQTGLTPDGFFGPKTRADLENGMHGEQPAAFELGWPLATLADGRRPLVTSSFRPKDRPDHAGLDLFYVWAPGDKPDFVGDKGCAGKKPNGEPKYVVPYKTDAIAAAEGIIQIAGNSPTGYRLWIDHGNGLRTGYFHLLDLKVAVGDIIMLGAPLGLVGDNPKDHDGRHLHFELSPSDRYAPMDPEPFLLR